MFREGWRELASGMGFTEGPVSFGGEVAFTSINRGLVYSVDPATSRVRLQSETGGGPNGAAVDGIGRIWVAQNGARVMRSKSHNAKAGLQVIIGNAAHSLNLALPDGVDLNAPNDCAFGPDDRLYFTDPQGRLSRGYGERPTGRLWAADTLTGGLELIADALNHPNGLAFSPNGNELWVSDTKTREIVAYSYVPTKSAWVPRVVDTVPWGQPDGIAFDAAGNLWVAATDAEGVAVRSAEGEWELVEIDQSFPTNVAFVGPDLSTVVVTSARRGRVVAASVKVPGIPLFTPQLQEIDII